MKIRTETETELSLWPGDVLTVTEKSVGEDGMIEEYVFVSDEIERGMSINKVVTFDVEKGDFGSDVVDGIGAAFLKVHS